MINLDVVLVEVVVAAVEIMMIVQEVVEEEVIVVAEMIIVMIVEEGEDGAITVVVVVIGAIEAEMAVVETGVEYTFTPMKRKENGSNNVDANVGHVNHYLM